MRDYLSRWCFSSVGPAAADAGPDAGPEWSDTTLSLSGDVPTAVTGTGTGAAVAPSKTGGATKDPLLGTIVTPTVGDVSDAAIPATAVLLVGEGDFSFARSLVELHHRHATAATTAGCAVQLPRFICTSLDSEATVLQRYAETSPANLARLGELGALVLHGVDGTALKDHQAVVDTLTTACLTGRVVTIFMFPHHCGKGRIDLNRKLLHDFFSSVATLLRGLGSDSRNGGHCHGAGVGVNTDWEIRVTLAPGQGGTEADGQCQREWNNSWQVGFYCPPLPVRARSLWCCRRVSFAPPASLSLYLSISLSLG